MKNLSAKTCLIAFFISLCTFGSKAQKITFEKGYMVNDKGNTLRGEVKYNPKKEQDCYNKVFFKDANGVQKSYKPQKIKAYGFNDLNFVSMEFENELKFYKVLSLGDINLYQMLVEGISMNEPVLKKGYYISHQSDPTKLTELKEGKFKKQMGEWMKDNTEFISSYEDTKDFNIDNAVEVIKNYNAWKAKQ